MKLIVGLGNPGQEYENNRHNLGFMVVDEIATKRGFSFRLDKGLKTKIAQIRDLPSRVTFIKPQAYMNNSGEIVQKVKNYYKIECENVWIIYDDVDLEFGKIRINYDGSSAGHRGVQSIIDKIGNQFWRVRVGIGKDKKIATDKWVLENFTKEEQEKLAKVIDKASDIVIESLKEDLIAETINI